MCVYSRYERRKEIKEGKGRERKRVNTREAKKRREEEREEENVRIKNIEKKG